MSITGNMMSTQSCFESFSQEGETVVDFGWGCMGSIGDSLMNSAMLNIMMSNSSDIYENTYQYMSLVYSKDGDPQNNLPQASYLASNALWYEQSVYETAMSKTWGNQVTMKSSQNFTSNGTLINTTGCCIPDSTTIAFVPNTPNISVNFNLGTASQNNTWCQSVGVSSNQNYTVYPWYAQGDATFWQLAFNQTSQLGIIYNVTEKSLWFAYGYEDPSSDSSLQCIYSITGNGGGNTGNGGDSLCLSFMLFIFSVMCILL
jgi:hypothetical protein